MKKKIQEQRSIEIPTPYVIHYTGRKFVIIEKTVYSPNIIHHLKAESEEGAKREALIYLREKKLI